MTATVKDDTEKKTVQYDTMANLMADVAMQSTAGYEMESFSKVALTVVYTKAL